MIAHARTILIRSGGSGDAACTILSPRFTADASIPQAFQSFRSRIFIHDRETARLVS
jgi:hypothetical protein